MLARRNWSSRLLQKGPDRRSIPTMRIAGLIFALASILGLYGCSHTNAVTKVKSTSSVLTAVSTESAKTTNKVDFATQIRPILESRCMPCHFSGGKVYQRMPFDRPETIKTLGTKLFTRLKDENERRVIRDFLAQE
ncbi:MAG: hypothetical protein M3R67_04355 [Acidobacteriota bacterium]|nr:hypothetical protein [Acidobacteriota bacterium]